MRTLRLSLVGAVILALLGGLGGAVLAQTTEEDSLDPMRTRHFTGTWGEVISEDPLESWEWGPGPPGSFEALGNDLVVPFEASDPRISGTWTQVSNMRTFPIDMEADVWAPVGSGAFRIENEAGAWAGTYDGYYADADAGGEWFRAEGEGAYEGLTAVFNWVGESDTYEGFIIPGVPADYPAPITATDEGTAEDDVTEGTMAESEGEPEAAANDDEADDAADEDGIELSGAAIYVDGLRTWQRSEGEDLIYELEMSDPRANGTYHEFNTTAVGHGYDGDSERPSIVGLGQVTLVNDEGSWAGLQSAVWDDEMGWRLTAWLAGEDAYEGLNLYLHAHRFPVYSEPWMDFDGIIFDGTPPVMLEAVQFPAE